MPQEDNNPPAIHNISFIGLTGAMFSCLAIGLFLYWEAFVTTSWIIFSNGTSSEQNGLWHACRPTPSQFSDQGWFLASQILLSVALFGVVLCFILAIIYMSVNKASKNLTLTSIVFLVFLTSILILTGLILLGSSAPQGYHISWSYGIAGLALAFFFIGGLLAVRQMKKSNVRVC